MAERAALLLRGIVQDHPFADGNKRTAYVATKVFLLRNQVLLGAEPDEIVEFMLQAAQGLTVHAILDWLEGHAKRFSDEVTE